MPEPDNAKKISAEEFKSLCIRARQTAEGGDECSLLYSLCQALIGDLGHSGLECPPPSAAQPLSWTFCFVITLCTGMNARIASTLSPSFRNTCSLSGQRTDHGQRQGHDQWTSPASGPSGLINVLSSE